jgi:hypothetical protein
MGKQGEAGKKGVGAVEGAVQRVVGVLGGKIEEMRADVQHRDLLQADMNMAVGDVAKEMRAVCRTVGRLQLPRVEGELCLRQLEKMGQKWEQQAAEMAGAVGQMREEIGATRVELGAVQAVQRELVGLVRGLGAGVGDVGSGLGGLGSSVRAIQRQLDARTGEQKRLAKLVSRREAEAGGHKTSPPATVRKERGMGRRLGLGAGRRLGFGAGAEEEQRERGEEQEREEQEHEQTEEEKQLEEEVEQVLAELRREEEAEERLREEREEQQREEQQREEQERQRRERESELAAAASAWWQECNRKKREEKEVYEAMSDEEKRGWRKTDLRESGRRMRKEGDERRERMQRDGYAEMSEEQRVSWIMHDTKRCHAEKVEGEREEREQWKLRWLERRKVEREMGMWDDGRERREEVQLFCCASTAD